MNSKDIIENMKKPLSCGVGFEEPESSKRAAYNKGLDDARAALLNGVDVEELRECVRISKLRHDEFCDACAAYNEGEHDYTDVMESAAKHLLKFVEKTE